MRPLWNHQVETIRMAEVCQDVFLAHEMGTGKTRTTIEILRRRYAKEKRLMKTLIVSPIIVCDNWKKEFALFSKINPNDILVLTETGKRRCLDLIKHCGEGLSRPKIVVTNYQGLLIKDFYNLLLAWGPEVLVCDESHRLKNHKAVTFKKAVALADKAHHHFTLSGTPILQSPADLWAQFRVLDGGETFGKNFYSFRNQYFIDANAAWSGKESHYPKWVPTERSYSALQEKIKRKTYRVTKEECLDLPPLIRQEIRVEMGKEQARMYKEMKQEYLAFVAKTQSERPLTVAAQLAVTKALRLQQLLSGYAATEQDGIHWLEDNPRLKALDDLLETITPGSKVIVWAVFKENYKMITKLCEEKGIGYAQIHGDISNNQRIEEMDRFRTAPECRVMVANQAAGGAGINLVEASYSIYYSKGFSLEQDLQSSARNHRAGSEQHEKITRIDLVCPGTIDELINEALAKKQNVADIILQWRG